MKIKASLMAVGGIFDWITLNVLFGFAIRSAIQADWHEAVFYLIAYGAWCCSMSLVKIVDLLAKNAAK